MFSPPQNRPPVGMGIWPHRNSNALLCMSLLSRVAILSRLRRMEVVEGILQGLRNLVFLKAPGVLVAEQRNDDPTVGAATEAISG
jgi:hypothetical protein